MKRHRSITAPRERKTVRSDVPYPLAQEFRLDAVKDETADGDSKNQGKTLPESRERDLKGRMFTTRRPGRSSRSPKVDTVLFTRREMREEKRRVDQTKPNKIASAKHVLFCT